MTQFNQLNMDMLDLKHNNQGLKEQKQELLDKLDKMGENKDVNLEKVSSFPGFRGVKVSLDDT